MVLWCCGRAFGTRRWMTPSTTPIAGSAGRFRSQMAHVHTHQSCYPMLGGGKWVPQTLTTRTSRGNITLLERDCGPLLVAVGNTRDLLPKNPPASRHHSRCMNIELFKYRINNP
jgi:hypothetical protein